MLSFYTRWKHQKTFGFQGFFSVSTGVVSSKKVYKYQIFGRTILSPQEEIRITFYFFIFWEGVGGGVSGRISPALILGLYKKEIVHGLRIGFYANENVLEPSK